MKPKTWPYVGSLGSLPEIETGLVELAAAEVAKDKTSRDHSMPSLLATAGAAVRGALDAEYGHPRGLNPHHPDTPEWSWWRFGSLLRTELTRRGDLVRLDGTDE